MRPRPPLAAAGLVMVVAFLAGLLPAAVVGQSPRPKPDAFAAYPTRAAATPRTVSRAAPTTNLTTSGRVAVQQTLGTAVSATIELQSGRRTGYQFSAAGKQVASKTVTFANTDAAPATRRMSKGGYTYYLLSWSSLSGYWVRLNANIRLVTPATWDVLVLVYRQTNIDIVTELPPVEGELEPPPPLVTHLEATMSPELEALLLGAVGETPGLATAWSSNLVQQRHTIVYPETTLSRLTLLEPGMYWLGPWDIAADLATYAPSGTYDSIVVLWQPWDEDTYIESWGWGLGLPSGPWSNGAAYATLTVPPADAAWWLTSMPFPGELYLHEWLHGAADYHSTHGATIPDLHDAERFGYADEGGSWRRWYTDFMQEHVRASSGSGYVGFDYRVWSQGTPSTVP